MALFSRKQNNRIETKVKHVVMHTIFCRLIAFMLILIYKQSTLCHYFGSQSKY